MIILGEEKTCDICGEYVNCCGIYCDCGKSFCGYCNVFYLENEDENEEVTKECAYCTTDPSKNVSLLREKHLLEINNLADETKTVKDV